MAGEFRDILRGNIVIVGIGNRLRGDDAAGSLLAEMLGDQPGITCFDVGTTPENHAGRIARERPDIILVVDAVHLGKKPGDYGVFSPEEISRSGLTTHDLSPLMFIDYLKQLTGARILFLGIQPASLQTGEGLSLPVKEALKEISGELKKCLS